VTDALLYQADISATDAYSVTVLYSGVDLRTIVSRSIALNEPRSLTVLFSTLQFSWAHWNFVSSRRHSLYEAAFVNTTLAYFLY